MTSRAPDQRRSGIAGIVVAGGRSSRLGSAEKASLSVDGAPLVDHALAALGGVSPLVLVGPEHLRRAGVLLTREDPPFGGPAAALAAGVRAVDASEAGSGPAAGRSDLVWILACDLPRAAGLVATVRSELAAHPLREAEDGVIVSDADGRDQWLAGLYRLQPLRDEFAALGEAHGASLRRVIGRLRLRRVRDPHGDAVDLDTWEDVRDYVGAAAARATAPGTEEEDAMSRTLPPELPEWIADVAPALGLDPAGVPAGLILDLTRDVAHTVTRPAGPVTTFLIGQAVAGGADPEAAAAAVTARVEAWRAAHPQQGDASADDSGPSREGESTR